MCSAIAASPAVSRQQRIAPPSLEVEIRNDQMSPALASRGADAFAVWTDSRVSGYGALFGSRIAADGTILDPFGILIDKSIGANPAVAWNGTDYLAVASQPEPHVASIDPLYAWQLTTDGKVRPSKTFVGRIRDPRLASNGRTIAIGGSQDDGGFFGFLDDTGRLHGTTRVSHVVGANVIPVADANDWFAFFDKPRCVNCPFTVHQLRVTNGSVISEKPLFEASAPRTLNAATDGRGRFAITWARLDP
ncbi:MAG TPA: hypothetical protein VE010_10610, partial [Thermoanaerobaculia bacterium]|nr:hypothetical protein [Thermoanaerobaculia bacterium]